MSLQKEYLWKETNITIQEAYMKVATITSVFRNVKQLNINVAIYKNADDYNNNLNPLTNETFVCRDEIFINKIDAEGNTGLRPELYTYLKTLDFFAGAIDV